MNTTRRPYVRSQVAITKLQKAREEKMERGLMYLRMYNSGMNLSEIGREVGLTRERIRQLVEYTGQYTKQWRHTRPLVEMKCQQCGRIRKVKLTVRSLGRKFCSTKCAGLARRLSPEQKAASLARKRIRDNERARRYYHDVLKKKPDFHERIRRYNENSKETRRQWMERNKDKINARIREKRQLQTNG